MKTLEMETDKRGLTTGEIYLGGGRGTIAWEENNLKPNTRYVVPVIEIPDGYRLVTDEDRKHPKPEGCRHWAMLTAEWDLTYLNGPYLDHFIHIIPIEPPKPKIEITVLVNGEPVHPSKISKDTWDNLRTETSK